MPLGKSSKVSRASLRKCARIAAFWGFIAVVFITIATKHAHLKSSSSQTRRPNVPARSPSIQQARALDARLLEVDQKRAAGSETQSTVCGDSILYCTAFVVVTKSVSTENFQAQVRTWLSVAPNVAVFETRGALRGVSFVEAFSRLYESFNASHVEWFVLIDDDGYIELENMAQLLSANSAKLPVYMGIHHCQGVDFACMRGKVKQSLHGWVNGGAGIILNRYAVDAIDWDEAIAFYEKNWPYTPVAADVALACTVQDYIQAQDNDTMFEITHVDRMYFDPVASDECECVTESVRFCTRSNVSNPVSFHHLKPNQLDERFQKREEAPRRRHPSYCMAGSSSTAFDAGDCVLKSDFIERHGQHCLNWEHKSGPWITTSHTSMCKNVLIHNQTRCVERGEESKRITHCTETLRWDDLDNPPPWTIDIPSKQAKFFAYGEYRKAYAPHTLLHDGGVGIERWLSTWSGKIFNNLGDKVNHLNDIKHKNCATILRGPRLCKIKGGIKHSSFDNFDAVFRKANMDSDETPCSGNRTTYGFTHTLDPLEVRGGLKHAEHGVFIPNDDVQIYTTPSVLYEGTRNLSVLSREFTSFARNATCPCSLPPNAHVVPGVTSGFYIVLASLLMCEQVTIFCWEQYGWGTPLFFEPNAKVNSDGAVGNIFANVDKKPESEHCLLEEFLWLQELREQGLVQYSCGGDRTDVSTFATKTW